MLYSPKVREDFVKKLYQLKQATPAKIPMIKIVNEAVEDYLNKKGVNIANKKKTFIYDDLRNNLCVSGYLKLIKWWF